MGTKNQVTGESVSPRKRFRRPGLASVGLCVAMSVGCAPRAARRLAVLDDGGIGAAGSPGTPGHTAGMGGTSGVPGDDPTEVDTSDAAGVGGPRGDDGAPPGSDNQDASRRDPDGGAGSPDAGGDSVTGNNGDGIVAPPFNDMVARNCNSTPRWRAGTAYLAGDAVVNGMPRRKFSCWPAPATPWCSQASHEPGVPTLHWFDAWRDLGACR